MTFDLAPAVAERRDTAARVARQVAGPGAVTLDRDLTVADDVVDALCAVLPGTPDQAPLDWVVALEAVAHESVALALAAAAKTLSRPSMTPAAQWPGCRGLDLDGAVQALGARSAWGAAVSAVLIGAGAAAVDQAVAVMKAAASKDQPTVAVPEIADAAAAVDAARLLLWDAVAHGTNGTAATAAAMARMQALDAVRLALTAAEDIVPAEGRRPGQPLERLRRDASTLAQVAGEGRAARTAVAAGTLQG